MSIVLIGYRGSGKTTIGRRLAERLWLKFVDLDEAIVQAAGQSVRDIFATEGEAHFRKLESTLLIDLLKLDDHVIALGGGTVLAEANRQAIASSGHKVIYLRCSPDILRQRIEADPHSKAQRPALTTAASAGNEVEAVMKVREPLYRQTMHSELDVSHLSPDDAVVYIVRML